LKSIPSVVVLLLVVALAEVCGCTIDTSPAPVLEQPDAAPSSPPPAVDAGLAIDTEHCARTPPVDSICASREAKATAFTCLEGYTPRPDVVCFYLPGETLPSPDTVDNTCCCPPGEWPCP